jgi:NAD/NADP transhydrogenase beta subunit
MRLIIGALLNAFAGLIANVIMGTLTEDRYTVGYVTGFVVGISGMIYSFVTYRND